MNSLKVIAYNVKFGDALLVAVPEVDRGREVTRHILIDVGNVLAGPGTDADVFAQVMDDVRRRLDGRPIDLYVMTHEHMDHVRGLSRLKNIGKSLPTIDYAWLTGSAHPRYYSKFREARRKRLLLESDFHEVRRGLTNRNLLGSDLVRGFLLNNDPESTRECVAFLRRVARKRTSFVHRGFTLLPGRNHPFAQASLTLLAPEKDTSKYYGRMRPVAPLETPDIPPGVSRDALQALMSFAQSGIGDRMLAIDRAANNTSVVFTLEWRGWRLLFPGDAELRSWRTMSAHRVLKPVHFLKVSHHASHNGTPPEELLEKILPMDRGDHRKRCALVSTCAETYSGVPDRSTMARIRKRVDRVYSTQNVEVGEAVEITFRDEDSGGRR